MPTSTEKLQTAFAAAIPLPADVDYEQVAYGVTDGWDSVAHMALIAEVEMAFDVMLATDDVIDMSSFTKAKEILAKHDVVFP